MSGEGECGWGGGGGQDSPGRRWAREKANDTNNGICTLLKRDLNCLIIIDTINRVGRQMPRKGGSACSRNHVTCKTLTTGKGAVSRPFATECLPTWSLIMECTVRAGLAFLHNFEFGFPPPPQSTTWPTQSILVLTVPRTTL